jgi:peptide/nickel transport system substrate-binding protein
MWAQTAHFVDDSGEPVVGGTLRVAMPDVLTDPWNPVAGTSWVYDMFPILATGDMGHWPDTRTGLRWPGRIEKAEVFAEPGVPTSVTNTDWCSLTFVPEIQVPLDAWADWDATQQKFITVQEKYGSNGTTAKTKSVSYYPKEIFDIPLHDGSTLSMGDFILYTILMFDRGKQASLMYDEAYAAEFESFMSMFKGVKFITDNPDYGLIVEYYSDQWKLDAELIGTTMFPFYSQGPGMWHTIALGIRAEEDGALAFSQSKSNTLGVEWMSFIDGPSLPFLTSYLTSAKATNYIPYRPTMGLYVTEAEAAERWANLQDWYAEKGHFWVGSGPFYLEEADTTNKVIHLKRFEDYPDPMDRWLFLLEPLS